MSILSEFARTDDRGNYNLTFLVEGIHCASCVQLIENALHADKDVINARVNMSTNRLNLVWQGSKERIDTLAQQVENLGQD